MIRFPQRAIAAAIALALAVPALAQTYRDSGGTVISAVVEAPFPYQPMAGTGQYGLSVNPAAGLTIPPGARYASVCAEGSTVRYTTSGTIPTASVGTPLLASSTNAPCVALVGAPVLSTFLAYSASGTLDVEYYK